MIDIALTITRNISEKNSERDGLMKLIDFRDQLSEGWIGEFGWIPMYLEPEFAPWIPLIDCP